MQIFNMINSRTLYEDLNVFKGILSHGMFVSIFIIIVIVQICLTQFSEDVFHCHREGLTLWQWCFCIGMGMTVFPSKILYNALPLGCFEGLNPQENEHKGKRSYSSDDTLETADRTQGYKALNEDDSNEDYYDTSLK